VSEPPALVAPGRPLLGYLPIGLFGAVMGLTGSSVAWRLAAMRYGLPACIAPGIGDFWLC
jgi:tellurite resistance protein